MSYLICIAGRAADCWSANALERVGLAGILDPANPPIGKLIVVGPDGGPGTLFAWAPRPRWGCFMPDRQEWTPAKGRGQAAAGRFWMGRDKARPIKPEAIARKRQISGLPCELGDGQRYVIPSWRRLPARFRFDRQTLLPFRVPEDAFADHYSNAESLFDWLMQNRIRVGVTIPGGVSVACGAISLNYRLCPELIDLFGLLSELAVVATIGATFGIDVQERLDAARQADESAGRPTIL